MSDLLLLVASPAGLPAAKADADPVWPSTPDGATLWAQHLHDELTAQPRLSSAAVGEVASWLRTQAVGRQTIVVSEPRVAKFAGVWAAAAVAAGVGQTRLVSPDTGGEEVLVEAIEPMVGVEQPTAVVRPVPRGRRARLDRARLWLVDRAEDTARLAVRAVQR
jgi:hypothetical protein